MDQERLVRVFQHFADKEFPGSSDLYAHLARQIAGDAEVLAIAAQSAVRRGSVLAAEGQGGGA
ncbi:hypothetical protein J2Z18_000238 [Paenibacillus lactis]|uniref:Uncharacterized protein n=1 Tax=Paenibacillus lactis TaxID=228574 RepID=A0ABS4F4J1_9BACL|nr:hypothetical protein [Paenibacillus lactis]